MPAVAERPVTGPGLVAGAANVIGWVKYTVPGAVLMFTSMTRSHGVAALQVSDSGIDPSFSHSTVPVPTLWVSEPLVVTPEKMPWLLL